MLSKLFKKNKLNHNLSQLKDQESSSIINSINSDHKKNKNLKLTAIICYLSFCIITSALYIHYHYQNPEDIDLKSIVSPAHPINVNLTNASLNDLNNREYEFNLEYHQNPLEKDKLVSESIFNSIENVNFNLLDETKFSITFSFLKQPKKPNIFNLENPNRIVFDFLDTKSKLNEKHHRIRFGNIDELSVVSSENQTRAIISLTSPMEFSFEIINNDLHIILDTHLLTTYSNQNVKSHNNIYDDTIAFDISSDLVKSTQKRSRDNKIYLSNAYEAYQRKNFLSAHAIYNTVLSSDENNSDALLGIAAVYVQLNQKDLAIESYQKILRLDPKNKRAIFGLLQLTHSPDAITLETQLKVLLEKEPTPAYLHFALGNIFASRNDWFKAKRSYISALNMDSNNANYSYNLAVSYDNLGDTELAISYYKHALSNINNSYTYFNKKQIENRIKLLTKKMK